MPNCMWYVAAKLFNKNFIVYTESAGRKGAGAFETYSPKFEGGRGSECDLTLPVLFVAFVVISISQAVAGNITADTLRLYAGGLPSMAAGLWSGFTLYGRINDETFRKSVLVLLLFAGASLIVPPLAYAWQSVAVVSPGSAPPI